MDQQQFDVLLIEDNASDAEMTIRALRKSNLANRLKHVNDGDEALDFLFSEGQYTGNDLDLNIKIILLDLKMSKVSGKEVLIKIKADDRTRKIPVVVLTSSREDADIKECYDLGTNGYVVKPVTFDEFHKAIADIGLYWLLINEPLHK
jgi:two-component system, response regulator